MDYNSKRMDFDRTQMNFKGRPETFEDDTKPAIKKNKDDVSEVQLLKFKTWPKDIQNIWVIVSAIVFIMLLNLISLHLYHHSPTVCTTVILKTIIYLIVMMNIIIIAAHLAYREWSKSGQSPLVYSITASILIALFVTYIVTNEKPPKMII